MLAVVFVFFTRGWIGGGDAKLAAATVLWLGFAHLVDYLVYASLLGGALTVALIQFRVMPAASRLSVCCTAIGRDWPWLCKNSTRYNRTRNFGPCGHAESKKT